jgi:hypothetical protein
MMNFTEIMSKNLPRLVVLFQLDEDGADRFQWGIVGDIPILTLIGRLVTSQSRLSNGAWLPKCDTPQPAFVIAWDEETRVMSHFIHKDIPTEPLVGMLETIKAMLVDSRLAQHAAAQRVQLLGPNGEAVRQIVSSKLAL